VVHARLRAAPLLTDRGVLQEVAWMSEYSMLSGSLMNHYGLFLPTVIGQGSDEQISW